MQKTIAIGIVGSRTLRDYEIVKKTLDKYVASNNLDYSNITIVSGGAAGADRFGERYANENFCKLLVFKPDWAKFGKRAGFIRNEDIVKNSNIVFAFHDGISRGTANSIKLTEKFKKDCKVINFESSINTL